MLKGFAHAGADVRYVLVGKGNPLGEIDARVLAGLAVDIEILLVGRGEISEANNAILDFLMQQDAYAWDKVSPSAMRVLLERQQQMLLVALANEKAHNPVTRLPKGLPKHAELPGVMLMFLHSMKLPWPAEDRSQFELPVGAPPASLRPN